MKSTRLSFRWFFLFTLGINIVLAISPQTDRLTWAMENSPVWMVLVILWFTRRYFPLTNLSYALLFIHAIILMIGGYYSYAKTPIFSYLRDIFQWDRNYYDRLGHLAQGFMPVIVIREILLRTSPLKQSRWLPFLCLSVCLAGSALFEIWEWRVAVILGHASEDYLGSQGDPWDAQWDMTCALLGALLSLALFSRTHDHDLREIAE